MNKILKSMFILLLSTATFAQATKLPDISVIGNLLATSSDESKTFEVKEIEFSFQHYLYSGVKANIFAALHKEESGERAFELEEAYVDFSNVSDVVFGISQKEFQLGAIIGKKFLNVGKVNSYHPEQWDFVDRAYSTQYVLGGEESLSAEGGQISYLLPVPFFSQLELGYWTASTHDEHEEEEEDEHSSIEYSNRLMTLRLWNGIELSDTDELEFSFSHLIGNASASSSDDQQNISAIDLQYLKEIGNNALKLNTEYYMAKYGEEGEDREEQNGYFISGLYKINNQFEAGLRYDFLGKHGDEGSEISQISYVISKRLTETSKFRLQYNSSDDLEDTILAQFIFGMGPHAHVLQ